MSGYTIRTPAAVLTTLIEGGQPAGSIDSQDLRDVLAAALSAEPNTQTISYTLALTDAWLCIEYNSSSAGNLLIPTDASVLFQIGTVIEWFQMGTGQLTIAAVTPGTTTLRPGSNTARAQGSSGAIRKRAANDWVLMGDVT